MFTDQEKVVFYVDVYVCVRMCLSIHNNDFSSIK